MENALEHVQAAVLKDLGNMVIAGAGIIVLLAVGTEFGRSCWIDDCLINTRGRDYSALLPSSTQSFLGRRAGRLCLAAAGGPK